jgi:DNA/RNA endonuclease YhcR with UshA esterase domain
MQEKTILKVSLIVILIGLSFLFFYAEELELQNVAEIDSIPAEEEVKMSGIISKVTNSEKVIFLKLEAEKKEYVDVLLFNEEEIFLKEGDYVEISGTTEEYQGKKEIIANKIVKK